MIWFHVVLCVLMIASMQAHALSLVVVHESIQVDVDFDGDTVAVFALPDIRDVEDVSYAFALIGPVSRYRVEQRGGQARVFYAPVVLSVAVEPDLYEKIPVKIRREADIDPVGLMQPIPERLYAAPPDPVWYEALDRLKTKAGLFWTGVRVSRLDGGLVRADLPLPAQSPVGDYRVRAVMFKDTEIISEAEKNLTLRRRGAEGFLYDLSRRSGLTYGLLAVLVAGLVGAAGAWFGRP